MLCGYSGEGVYPVNGRCQALDGAMEKTTTSGTNHTHKRSRRVSPHDAVEKKHKLSDPRLVNACIGAVYYVHGLSSVRRNPTFPKVPRRFSNDNA